VADVAGDGGATEEEAERWFPGMVIRSIVRPEAADAVATPAALATLGAYAAVCGAVITIVMSRRDVTG
jgi:hypothetical protein